MGTGFPSGPATNKKSPHGLIIAAPNSGSGKTLVTLGLLAALRKCCSVVPAKTGPDYIDPAFLSRAANADCINLDPWAMPSATTRARAASHATGADLLLIEGVMGLFDGAANGQGSTGDLASMLNLPVILVVDAARQSHSIAALVSGFANWRNDVRIAGIILNKVGSPRHTAMLKAALEPLDIPVIGALPRLEGLEVPSRHLGLILPTDLQGFDAFLHSAETAINTHLNLDLLQSLATPLPTAPETNPLPPLGQHISIARDAAFAFLYQHWLNDWCAQGAEISFFSPLADEAPAPNADAIFLPGGYPELHGETLANAENFRTGLKAAQSRNALIYGECGGFMALGQGLTDKHGTRHQMTGLLPVETRMDQPRRTLGYRHLSHTSPLPFPQHLTGHEFHYSSAEPPNLPALFTATDALGAATDPMGAILGTTMGSYAHIIDRAA